MKAKAVRLLFSGTESLVHFHDRLVFEDFDPAAVPQEIDPGPDASALTNFCAGMFPAVFAYECTEAVGYAWPHDNRKVRRYG